MPWDHFKGWVSGMKSEEAMSATTLPDFNPSGDDRINHIKRNIEHLIEFIVHMKDCDGRCKSIAITKLEEGAMWAVKGLFVK